MTEERGAGDSMIEAAVGAFIDAMRALLGSLQVGEWADSTDLVAYTTHLLMPRFNGLLVLGPDADESTAAARLDEVVDLGLPFAVLSRPSAPHWVARLATTYGLTTHEHEPFMCHPDPAALTSRAVGPPHGLVIDVVDPSDAAQVSTAARLLADGFEAPVDLLAPLVAPEVLAVPGMTAYVGRSDGEPCTTGFGALTHGHVGVFNIATPPAQRRRGFGHAVTSRVVTDGVRGGAHTAYLQSSPMGLGVYDRLGFRTVETWTCYYPS